MNIELNAGQSDTRCGDLTLPGAVNLTGLENTLVKITNNNGVANFTTPAAVTDQANFILMSGDVAGNPSAAEAPSLNENCRVMIDSTNAIVPGDQIALSPNKAGYLYKPVAAAGAGVYKFIAESAVAAGSNPPNPVKVRRICDTPFNL